MAIFWYCAVALMLVTYAVLDGFDIGAGILHLIVARNDEERRLILRTLGPVWDGNEVWLIAGGGTLFMGFPRLYAESFSGFYLPLMFVLWLLILRGIAIEFRHRVNSQVWAPLWDFTFSGASAALAGVYGAALGNIVRGVPLNPDGSFFLPLWTDFRVSGAAGILDWFTLLVALGSFLALAQHGALWVAMKVEGELEERCRQAVRYGWWAVGLATLLLAAVAPLVQPHLLGQLRRAPWGVVFPAIALAALWGVRHYNRPETGSRAFISSCAYVAGILASAAFGLFPNLLPSNQSPDRALTVFNTAAPADSLFHGILWFIPGIALAITYTAVAYRGFSGKVSLEGEGY